MTKERMSFEEWFLEAYGRKFDDSSPKLELDYELEYIDYLKYQWSKPGWENSDLAIHRSVNQIKG